MNNNDFKEMVSILIPVYNAAEFLRQCLDSIVSQTYQELQVVIIDDGSTDDSLSICEEYATKHAYFEVYHQENIGVAKTRNRLLDHVAGDYVLFIDADDWIDPQMVEYLETKARTFHADIVTCHAFIFENDKVENNVSAAVFPVQEEVWDRERIVREFLGPNAFMHVLWSKLFDAKFVRNARFVKEISHGEDSLFVWQLFQKVEKVVMTTRKLYHYRMSATSITHQSFSLKKMSLLVACERIYEDTVRFWPQYVDFARANLCLANMQLLISAAQCNYKNKEQIQKLQRDFRKNLTCLKRVNLVDCRLLRKAIFLSHGYFLYRIMLLLRRVTVTV